MDADKKRKDDEQLTLKISKRMRDEMLKDDNIMKLLQV